MSDDAAGQIDAPRGGVYSRSFLALVATQFFVSLNDNIFRWLVISIGKELLLARWAEMPSMIRGTGKPEETAYAFALSLGSACFTLPFLLFAAPAGYFADRFSKRRVMVACKVIELLILGVGIEAIRIGSVPLMFLTLFILGGQAMMFITSKLGSIPEIVRSDKLASANGLINMASMSAIILGAVAGTWLAYHTRPAGQTGWWLYASALLGVAFCGLITSLFIRPLKAANSARPIPWNPAAQTVRDLRILGSNRSVFLAGLGSAYFWALGMLSQLNIDQFATIHLGVNQEKVGPLLAALTIGIGGGALLAGAIARGKVELGLVPFGGIGIAGAAILMIVVPAGVKGHFPLVPYWTTATLLMAMGIMAGLYNIPLEAFLQDRSDPRSRGSIMAAYNFLTFSGMLLASGVFLLLSGPLKLSPSQIFLFNGLATIVVTIIVVRRLPFETTRLFVRMLVGCMYRLRVEGTENVPPGGALIVANHVSWADGVLLGLACPRHPRIIAFSAYFENRWLGWFGRLGRIIPIGNSRKSMVDSIRTAREALQQGQLVCIFPEGGITRTGETAEFRGGFLTILKDSGVPVVPAHLGGLWGSVFSYEGGRFFWKWPRRWRYPVTIRFGKPICHPDGVNEVRQAVEQLRDAGLSQFSSERKPDCSP